MSISPSASVQTLMINDHEMAFICLNPHAQGKPYILLHGFSSTALFWKSDAIGDLLKRGCCWSISLPAHFPAHAPASFIQQGFDLDTLLELIEATMDQIVGSQPITLIGHSTGAFLALALAAKRPEKIERVVSVSGFVKGRWTGLLGLSQFGIRCFGRFGEWQVKATFAFFKFHLSIYRWILQFYVVNPKNLHHHPDFWRHSSCSFVAYRQSNLQAFVTYLRCMPNLDIQSLLGHIKAPVLVMYGSQDPIIPSEQPKRLCQHIPKVTAVKLPDVGHLPMFECITEFQTILLDWLEKTDTP